ncbi:MAG: hypothetical protein Q7V63_07055 [Gammaproteobacteria bacterium]|nr:hypothetical protein [Gammaproteobacteria bacterium]
MSTDKNINKLQELDKKLAQRERLENQLRSKSHKEDTRRKILAGAWASTMQQKKAIMKNFIAKYRFTLIAI